MGLCLFACIVSFYFIFIIFTFILGEFYTCTECLFPTVFLCSPLQLLLWLQLKFFKRCVLFALFKNQNQLNPCSVVVLLCLLMWSPNTEAWEPLPVSVTSKKYDSPLLQVPLLAPKMETEPPLLQHPLLITPKLGNESPLIQHPLTDPKLRIESPLLQVPLIAPKMGTEPHEPTHTNAGIWATLIFFRSCANNHGCYEFTCATSQKMFHMFLINLVQRLHFKLSRTMQSKDLQTLIYTEEWW